MNPELSIIIPAYNEEKSLQNLYNELIKILNPLEMSFEIILIDDGSKDKTFDCIKEISKNDSRVKGLTFSRNFGHQIALLAGFEHAKGELIVSMDADLQHPPHIIPQLIAKQKEGFDIVNTRRIDSTDVDVFKKITSKMFYKFINLMSDVKIEVASADFRIMNRKSVEGFLKLPEQDRFTRGLISWIGYKQAIIDYNCMPRFDGGKSRYTFRKMLRFAFDGITSFSSKPLRISFVLGLIVFIFGLIYALFAIIRFLEHKTIEGWTSLIVTILLLGGIQLLCLGIIGEYIARIFKEAKARPTYLIKDVTENLLND